ncbi:MAG TPA: helix-hairpin-helix domain-containing protein [Gemmatirosa sp.]
MARAGRARRALRPARSGRAGSGGVTSANHSRRLRDLRSVGPATVRDLAQLGVTSVEALAGCEPDALYDRLCAVTGVRHDPCVRDVFAAAVAQARDPELPAEQGDWWWWSRQRVRGDARRSGEQA